MSYNSSDWFADLRQAIQNMENLAISGLASDIEQDAFIKRFELAYELSWKWMKSRIQEEGLITRSPRQVFKEAVSLGLIKNERSWLEMIEVRNTLVHTYNAVKARELIVTIRDDYLPVLRELIRQ